MSTSKMFWCSLAVALFALPTISLAEAVNVDFDTDYFVHLGDPHTPAGTYSGTGAAPDAGTVWNGINVSTYWPTGGNTSSGPLVNSLGEATSVSISINNFGGFDATNTDINFYVAPALMNDLANTAGPGTFTISGLVSGSSYDVYLYACNGSYNSNVATFTIGGVSKTVTNSGNPGGFALGTNYTVFSGVVAAGGSISGSLAANGWNGFQVVGNIPVPEPSATILITSGLFGLLAYAWRKRR